MIPFERSFVRDPFTLIRVKFLVYCFENLCLNEVVITKKNIFSLFCFRQVDFWRFQYQSFLQYQFSLYYQRFWSSLYAEQCRCYSVQEQSNKKIKAEILKKTSYVFFNRLMYDLITGSSWGSYMQLRRLHYLFYQKIKTEPTLTQFIEQLFPDQQDRLDWVFPILDDQKSCHLWVEALLTWRVLIYSYLLYPVEDYSFDEIFRISPNNYSSTIMVELNCFFLLNTMK